MERIKVGVIGLGFIGPAHIEALNRTSYVDVIAVADDDEEMAKRKAEELCVKKAYSDYKALLEDEEIEAVHICTPNHLHYPMAKAALLANKHVVCEKPLAMRSEEASELIQIANERNLAHAVHFNIRFYPLIHQAKKMVEDGEVGKILAINGSYQQDWLFYPTDYNWRLEPEFSGESRAIADIGSHWLDLVEYITGNRVIKVCADYATFHKVRKKPLKPVATYTGKELSPEDYSDIPITTEDYATVLLRFDEDAHGSLTVNQVAAGRKNRIYFEIYGTKKAISWSGESPNEMWIGRRDGNNEVLMKDPSLFHTWARKIISYPGGHNEGFPDTSKQFFSKFYRYILNKGFKCDDKPEFPTFEAGHRELILCENICTSAKEEMWISI